MMTYKIKYPSDDEDEGKSKDADENEAVGITVCFHECEDVSNGEDGSEGESKSESKSNCQYITQCQGKEDRSSAGFCQGGSEDDAAGASKETKECAVQESANECDGEFAEELQNKVNEMNSIEKCVNNDDSTTKVTCSSQSSASNQPNGICSGLCEGNNQFHQLASGETNLKKKLGLPSMMKTIDNNNNKNPSEPGFVQINAEELSGKSFSNQSINSKNIRNNNIDISSIGKTFIAPSLAAGRSTQGGSEQKNRNSSNYNYNNSLSKESADTTIKNNKQRNDSDMDKGKTFKENTAGPFLCSRRPCQRGNEQNNGNGYNTDNNSWPKESAKTFTCIACPFCKSNKQLNNSDLDKSRTFKENTAHSCLCSGRSRQRGSEQKNINDYNSRPKESFKTCTCKACPFRKSNNQIYKSNLDMTRTLKGNTAEPCLSPGRTSQLSPEQRNSNTVKTPSVVGSLQNNNKQPHNSDMDNSRTRKETTADPCLCAPSLSQLAAFEQSKSKNLMTNYSNSMKEVSANSYFCFPNCKKRRSKNNSSTSEQIISRPCVSKQKSVFWTTEQNNNSGYIDNSMISTKNIADSFVFVPNFSQESKKKINSNDYNDDISRPIQTLGTRSSTEMNKSISFKENTIEPCLCSKRNSQRGNEQTNSSEYNERQNQATKTCTCTTCPFRNNEKQGNNSDAEKTISEPCLCPGRPSQRGNEQTNNNTDKNSGQKKTTETCTCTACSFRNNEKQGNNSYAEKTISEPCLCPGRTSQRGNEQNNNNDYNADKNSLLKKNAKTCTWEACPLRKNNNQLNNGDMDKSRTAEKIISASCLCTGPRCRRANEKNKIKDLKANNKNKFPESQTPPPRSSMSNSDLKQYYCREIERLIGEHFPLMLQQRNEKLTMAAKQPVRIPTLNITPKSCNCLDNNTMAKRLDKVIQEIIKCDELCRKRKETATNEEHIFFQVLPSNLETYDSKTNDILFTWSPFSR